MAIKQEFHAIKGIQRDLTVSKFSPEYAFDAHNIRLTARDGNNLLSVTNEKGTKELILKSTSGEVTSVEGTLIGYNTLNEYLTLFTTGGTDRIYRLENKGDYFETILLFSGNLNFSTDYPIENIGVYENDNIQKVYWVDGRNQPRVVNIVADNTDWNNNSFDFIPELKLTETITVTSNTKVSGEFPSGVLQYAFTYYNRYGAESNIIYQTPIYYTHSGNRGGSPEEKGSNSFDITITNSDTNFDYIRIYSIFRTSIDGTPVVTRVADLKTSDSVIRYTDNNTTGSSVDSTLLLYIGGEEIIPYTMSQKDNTLFLGNIKLKRSLFSQDARTNVRGNVVFSHKIYNTDEKTNLYFNYNTQLNSNSYQITSFKRGETYRFGVQFQDRKGKWSEVLYMCDRKVDTIPSISSSPTTNVKLSLIKPVYVIPSSVIAEAKSLGYVRARGMIVMPTNSDRTILCQGIVCPTLYNTTDRNSNSPYAVSSWFFRPFVDEANREDTSIKGAEHGTYARYVDLDGVNPVYPDRTTEIGTVTLRHLSENETEVTDYLVDSSIVTFHSPDIEFGNINTSNINLNCNIVGSIALESGISHRSVIAENIGIYPEFDYGFYPKFPKYVRHDSYATNRGGRLLSSGYHWFGVPLATNDTNKVYTTNWAWLVSPWQRQGSLINDFRYGETTYSNLKSNKLSNLRTSYETHYGFGTILSWTPPEGISNVEIVDSNELEVTQLLRNNESLIYYGNVDRIIPPGNINVGEDSCVGLVSQPDYSNLKTTYQLYTSDSQSTNSIDKIKWVNDTYIELKDNERFSKSPVHIKYKSGKHAVFAFNKQDGKRVILPANSSEYSHTSDSTAIYATFNTLYSGLWVAELTQTIDDNTRFGGKTEEALLNNRWIVAGDPINIYDSSTIEYLQGDTYIQRYDCLKTYPYTNEDLNSVTDIVSFYCETHINIDGRYDRNRGNITNLAINPTTFNLYNPVYTQSNSYFTYQYLNELSNLNDFPNSITWTEEKILGNETDSWTKINMAATLDLDGDKGEITSLNTFNNEIYCFQRRGLSNILFNSRVQIPASDGVPIEITNGLKVGGKRYVSNSIGCTNKWSIAESPSGLYFIDNETNSLYLFNGQIQSLSDKLGFRQWVSDNNSHKNWDSVNYNNFRSFYDKNNNDVYFTNKNECLCYSELLGQFTSFMSYEKVPAMFNIDSGFYSFNKNKLWQNFEGDYNMFYGEFKPYSITIVANSDEPYDKIFNTVEFRADSWNGDKLINNQTFDTLDVWNEYQHGTSTLANVIGKPSPLKKKFRVWRANVPRDNSNKRDRIRNTWAYVKLSMNTPNTWKTELHDMMVHYFI